MLVALFTLLASLLVATPAPGLDVAEIGSFHVGGRQVTLTGLPKRELRFTRGAAPFMVDPNGDFDVEQMYLQSVKLARPKGNVPMQMWHGGGLTGITWREVPHLFVWGDYLDRPALWHPSWPTLRKSAEGLTAAGGSVDWLDLPKRGIPGNTHKLMMDPNSDEIAALVQDWLVKRQLLG